jgi:menaquinone-dependent protoporphyrinogen oxidase
MGDTVLVAYGTWAGSTAEVAEEIGKTLREAGLNVDVKSARDVDDVSAYGGVVVGSGVRAGKLHSHVLRFLKAHQAAMSQVPVAYFVVCLSMMKDAADNDRVSADNDRASEEERREAMGYLDGARQAAPQIDPIGVGLFGGVMDFSKLGGLMRFMMRTMKSPEGDYRDWDAIRDWAREIRPALSGG